ncbi:PHA/PHB synthase family protein [Maliponia aquimaris]|uniref:Poly-beta-hydroxybutyrate polymerase n=1 Tax=Maliponia aquimaris TaxID=1673631 RepID=A0A238L007_9RHOB|nr:alpha/beta fold hydrolase [Maliponia aquimaris]SMX48151.1 Poly-beta-hydroxybutyrate polymerase [Maliponia aquimaris]
MRKISADRVGFMVRQALDMVSPSNLPGLNPEVVERALKTGGRNFTDGARHLSEDTWRELSGHPAPGMDGFKVGRDLVTTPGQVAWRNDLIELIQYAPATDKVRAEPMLIVSAWTTKYYILDLSPENSLIAHLVTKGYSAFVISWCNPTADQRDLSLEDYRDRGVMEALEAVQETTGAPHVQARGACLGGTILAIAAAAAAGQGDDRLASVTLLAGQTDFSEAGASMLVVDDSQIVFLDNTMWDKGCLDTWQTAAAFRALRPKDLSAWNADATRMPYRMHSEYLRGLFLENRLTAGRFLVEGRVIALKDISAPNSCWGPSRITSRPGGRPARRRCSPMATSISC